ncbi:PLP-dependent aminotransferase family protein [Nitrincola tibetensis]|uniref:PLP-dependent aminotransferase family protein n=1 Tax=Nitrincola tibetensis TaxID=2219697 RepID=A0A364NMK1_9GAMM|nr:PLP-dependent aminotransferase family protein [Nitrincola tibetensis]
MRGLSVSRSPLRYRYQQVEAWLFEGIEQKRWRLGEKLPSIRRLCQLHQVSKATVLHALTHLEAQGWIEARPKSGYFVTYQVNPPKAVQSNNTIDAPRLATLSDLFLDIMQRSAAFDLLPSSLTLEESPGIRTLNRSIARALRQQKTQESQYYDSPAGDASLRSQLSIHQARRGWQVGCDQLCITSGTQHGLFLALMASCQRGDIVAVESPGFYGVLQLLESLGLQVIEVPSSASHGMDMEVLETMLQRWPIRACVVSPSFSTPSGALMPIDRQRRLLDLAESHDVVVIEDDIYSDTALGEIPAPLKALDTTERVILCSSFSKSLSRDLRVGWVCGGRWHQQIQQLKVVTQLANSRFLQQGIAHFMAEGGFAAHLRRQRQVLQGRRDQLITSLNDWPIQPMTLSRPLGGLSIWLELPETVNTLNAYSDALRQGIVITPGPLFSISGRYTNCLRLSFAHPWNEQRLQALAQLKTLLFE